VSFAYWKPLVEAIKALPQHARRFDKRASVWRIDSTHIRTVVERAIIEGCPVLLGEHRVALGEIVGSLVLVERCPHCGSRHTHGLGDDGVLLHRVAHCAGPRTDTRSYTILARRPVRDGPVHWLSGAKP
jgi:hypothetical protein